VVQFFRVFQRSLKNWTTLPGWWPEKTSLYSLTGRASNRIQIKTVVERVWNLVPYFEKRTKIEIWG